MEVVGERRKHEHSKITKSDEEDRVTKSLYPPRLSLGKSAMSCFQSSLKPNANWFWKLPTLMRLKFIDLEQNSGDTCKNAELLAEFKQ